MLQLRGSTHTPLQLHTFHKAAMVKVAVAVSLVSKSGGDHCTGLSVFLADEDCSFTDVQRKVVAQLKVQLQCQKCILLYRGCEVSVCSRDMKIKHCCPASTSCPRFTAIYFKYEGDCLEVRLGPPIAHLEPPPDKSVSLMVNFDTVTALDLKHLIFHTTKRPVYTQRIARILFARGPRIFEYLGHPLNDHKTLTSQGIGNGDELSLSLPPLTRNTAYSHGLNMEGTCCNSFCCAYKQTVVSSHIPSSEPMQLYDQLVDSSYLYSYAVNPSCIYHHCPMCGKQSKIQSCGFTDCFWAYDSRQYGKNWQMEDICSSWQYVPKNKYHRFKLDTATWHNLVFIVRTAYDNPSADQQDMAAECQICYASAGADVVTACGCSFHPSCLTAWKRFQSKLGCSVCKGPISNLQVSQSCSAMHIAQRSPDICLPYHNM